MENRISASLMCVDPFDLRSVIGSLEKYGVDYLHIDIMDGKFVPNLGLGTDYIRWIRKHSNLPCDYHIMAYDPSSIANMLDFGRNDIISVHYESSPDILKTLKQIKRISRCTLMVALSPKTPFNVLEEIINSIDGINLLMVSPGFAGQKILQNSFEKAKDTAGFIKKMGKEGLILEVDGNVSFENAKTLKGLGANMFVAGSSSIFSSVKIEDNILKLKESILDTN